MPSEEDALGPLTCGMPERWGWEERKVWVRADGWNVSDDGDGSAPYVLNSPDGVIHSAHLSLEAAQAVAPPPGVVDLRTYAEAVRVGSRRRRRR